MGTINLTKPSSTFLSLSLKKPLWIAVLALGFSSVGLASVDTKVDAKAKDSIQAQINKMIPNAPQVEISTTPVAGLFQVKIGMDIIYMTGDGTYLLNGALVNLNTRENLTENALFAVRKAAMDKVSESSMIVYPASNKPAGDERFMTVFTDIDCPYCHKLHNEIPALNAAGITVRYLAYPRAGVGSGSYNKAVSVWCADDKLKAMDNAMQKLPVESKQCANPVQDHMMQAQLFGVNGTPNIILDSGELLPGYVPAKELIKVFTAN